MGDLRLQMTSDLLSRMSSEEKNWDTRTSVQALLREARVTIELLLGGRKEVGDRPEVDPKNWTVE